MSDQSFRVGDWVIEPRLGVFRRSADGASVRVRAKVMDLLVFFAGHAGQVLTKDALLNGVWQTEAISESALTRTIAELRQALGDDAERPAILETIPKRGYRLIAPVSAIEPASPPPDANPGSARQVLPFTVALAATVVVVAAAVVTIAWNVRSAASVAQLDLKPHDLVLIARFDNATGEPVFDGAVEYALERELSGSRRVRLVPLDRVYDALRLMKRPLDTVIDRTIGREICLRDGRIKAMVAGRIEKAGSRYILTTQLIDPSDNSVVTTVTGRARDFDEILHTLSRSAAAVREALGEQRDRIRSPAGDVEQASTASLRAFQLYDRSYRLGSQGRWNGALELARQAVGTDPQFASGWIWLAWSLFRTQHEMSEVRAAAERAVGLLAEVADWERHWIIGSYRLFAGDYVAAAQSFEALLALRPDHIWGVNNLQMAYTAQGKSDAAVAARQQLATLRPHDLYVNHIAAAEIIRHTRSVASAQPYIDRVRALIGNPPAESDTPAAAWLALLPAYQHWASGDVRGALQQVEEQRRTLPAPPQPGWRGSANLIASFYLCLGRLDDADRLYAEIDSPGSRAIVAEVRRDFAAMRKWLLRMDNPAAMRVERFVKAGLIDHARTIVSSDTGIQSPAQTFTSTLQVVLAKPLGRGYLALHDGRLDLAVTHLRHYVTISKHMSDASPYSACMGLATAFARLNRLQDAIETLEACAARVPPYFGVFAGSAWLEANVQLADAYRMARRPTDARAVEDRVAAFLAVADADHPLVLQLQQRRDNRLRSAQ